MKTFTSTQENFSPPVYLSIKKAFNTLKFSKASSSTCRLDLRLNVTQTVQKYEQTIVNKKKHVYQLMSCLGQYLVVNYNPLI